MKHQAAIRTAAYVTVTAGQITHRRLERGSLNPLLENPKQIQHCETWYWVVPPQTHLHKLMQNTLDSLLVKENI